MAFGDLESAAQNRGGVLSLAQTIGNLVADGIQQAGQQKSLLDPNNSDWTSEGTTGETVHTTPVEVSDLPPITATAFDPSDLINTIPSLNIANSGGTMGVPIPTPRPYTGDLDAATAAGYTDPQIAEHLSNGDHFDAQQGGWFGKDGIENVIVDGTRSPEDRSGWIQVAANGSLNGLLAKKPVKINVAMHYYWAANVAGSRYHSYLEIRNGNQHYYLSGGPAIRNGSGPLYFGLDAVGLVDLDPSMGDLKAWASPTRSDKTFSMSSKEWSVQIGTVTMPWDDAVAVLTNEANAVDNGHYPYSAVYDNSNSLAFSGARALGLSPTPPSDISVPAWDHTVPPGK